MIQVVAAIIRSSDSQQVLLSLRKAAQHQGGRWEFPGGKIDPGEHASEALVRELQEELGITALQYSSFQMLEHHYPDKSVRLHFWQVTQFRGEPTGCESQRIQWVNLSELAQYEFPAANLPVVAALMAEVSAAHAN